MMITQTLKSASTFLAVGAAAGLVFVMTPASAADERPVVALEAFSDQVPAEAELLGYPVDLPALPLSALPLGHGLTLDDIDGDQGLGDKLEREGKIEAARLAAERKAAEKAAAAAAAAQGGSSGSSGGSGGGGGHSGSSGGSSGSSGGSGGSGGSSGGSGGTSGGGGASTFTPWSTTTYEKGSSSSICSAIIAVSDGTLTSCNESTSIVNHAKWMAENNNSQTHGPASIVGSRGSYSALANAWMASPGHAAVINSQANTVVVGCYWAHRQDQLVDGGQIFKTDTVYCGAAFS